MNYVTPFRGINISKKSRYLVVVGVCVLSLFISSASIATAYGEGNPEQPIEPPVTEVVTEESPDWSTADTRPGGNVEFIEQADAPSGEGVLELTTDETNAAKAQLMTATDTLLKDVNALSYITKQNAANTPSGGPSYQLTITDLNNSDENAPTHTNLVYEPYWNGVVTPDVWQTWDVFQGLFWSSRTTGGMIAGAGGPPHYTLHQVLLLNPSARVVAFGTSIGTYNPEYDVNVDMLRFNDTVYDFEPLPPAQTPPTTPSQPTTPTVVLAATTTTTTQAPAQNQSSQIQTAPRVLSDSNSPAEGKVSAESTETTTPAAEKKDEAKPSEDGSNVWWIILVILAALGALYAWWRQRQNQDA